MTAPAQAIGAMSSGRVFLGELLSSRARLRFPGQTQAPTTTPVRPHNCSERQTRTSPTVSPKGVTPNFPLKPNEGFNEPPGQLPDKPVCLPGGFIFLDHIQQD